MSIWDYADSFPNPPPAAYRITLGEGRTPVVRSKSIGPAAGIENLYLKLETTNPTGSYKDRFAASAVSHLVADGAELCIGCSSGNTGAALAAYAAAARIPCILAIVDSAPDAKLVQMQVYGAKLVRLKGFGVDADVTSRVTDRLADLAARFSTEVQISAFCHSPRGMTGVQSISMELADSEVPIHHVFCPAGAGGLALAVARGFDATGVRPAIHCVQPEGNDTIASRLRDGFSTAAPCTCTTAISGLQVANVMDGTETLLACRASGGSGHVVSDEAAFEAQERLAKEEGIFAEPAGAVALAGAIAAVKGGDVPPEAAIVCLVTGSGFKDEVSQRRILASSSLVRRVATFDEFEAIVKNQI